MDKKEREKLILDNLSLVKKVASKIYYRLPKGDIEFDDLVNVGVIGLMKAIEKYDKDKARFSTYAYIKIRGEILDYLRSLDIVPRTVRDKIKKEPPLEEGKPVPLSNTAVMVSIEKALSSDESFKIIDTLVSGRETPEEEVIKEDQKEKLLKALELLSEKEKKVLQMLYFEEKDLKAVAEEINVSVSRVSQIKSEAIKKLKSVYVY
ncbi:RNA polymerase, sigma 28 subunit, SigD/FliA/WhiG [Persephonella hydrogeniphila]|uniref:RNA polymerase, sigma 28 subunit, SigD/FliA/WhiG n=1 Tax=Persephonella hydrogeniphila TaxID=198703 RepID=A0A285NJS0_9AQUI|nr:sigma-70 family RNA polymerase sigma factor [Persephonella hydrogeniphila]SNZ08116.1 RNA polymerase, sigma 28 subunit, SigD/FliA/WhiG [Persephonella hydrogeniphila]